MKKAVLGLCIGILAGCGSNNASDPNTIINNDFENLDGWIPSDLSPTLVHDKAHSGRYALRVDGPHEYSLTFNKELGQLHGSRMTNVKLSAWVLRPTAAANAALVFNIVPATASDKSLVWESIDIGKEAKATDKWTEVSKTIAIPATVGPLDKLRIYLWRNGSDQPVYLDDLKLTLVP